jgi:hypothetical protein
MDGKPDVHAPSKRSNTECFWQIEEISDEKREDAATDEDADPAPKGLGKRLPEDHAC